MKRPRETQTKVSDGWRMFHAEAAYADSIFRSALGDVEGSIAALKNALRWKRTYAPAILSMGSVDYQLGQKARGRKRFLSLVELREDIPDLCEIIDKAGSFLIQRREYADGLELFRAAVKRFPDAATLYDGIGCCAGHEGFYDEAIAAAQRALELEPDKQEFVNDLGWSLLQAGHHAEAKKALERAVEMDPSDELARENLRICREQFAGAVEDKRPRKKGSKSSGRKRKAPDGAVTGQMELG